MISLRRRLEQLSLIQLAEVHNAVPRALRVSKFSDHTTAVRRTEMALQRAGCEFTVLDSGEVRVAPAGDERVAEGDDRVIWVIAERCPKQSGSLAARRWALLRPGMTLGQYLERVVAAGEGRRQAVRDMEWGIARGHLWLGPGSPPRREDE